MHLGQFYWRYHQLRECSSEKLVPANLNAKLWIESAGVLIIPNTPSYQNIHQSY